ncbi:MAG: C39 family peptidase [Oscillospiraceae bacterium]|jgi:hypothetical protein|nr:C39 family peptidase [Oscillospiraceae bacterium]
MNKQPVSYFQTDNAWRGADYSAKGEKTTIGAAGCGPTSAAMLIATLAQKTVTPLETVAWSLAHGYKAVAQGTYYTYFVPQFSAYGIVCKRLNAANIYGHPNDALHETAKDLVKQGYYLIACMGVGNWTTGGHYIVVWDWDDKVRINDPASTLDRRVNGDPALFKAQVKYYWAIDAREYNKEDKMTQDEFNKMFEAALAAHNAEIAKKPAHDWAKDIWERVCAYDVANGQKLFDGTNPQGDASREQLAALFERLGLLK